MLHKIVLAHDGSNHADKALDLAITLAKATGSELEIVNVVSDQSLNQDELTLAETEYGTAIHRNGLRTRHLAQDSALGVAGHPRAKSPQNACMSLKPL